MHKNLSFYVLFMLLSSLSDKRIHTETRHSVIDRLEKHTLIVTRCITDCQKLFKDDTEKEEKAPLFKCYCSQFENDLIRWCSKQIEEKNRIKILGDTWSTFKRYYKPQCNDDLIFLHNYAALLFILYQQLSFILKDKNEKDLPSICDVITLYYQVSSLHLEKIIDLLDHSFYTLQQISSIVAALEGGGWGKNIWWTLPVVASAFYVAYIRHFTHYPLPHFR